MIFDGRAAWGQSENKVNPLGLYTDDFSTDRWLLSARLTGDFASGPWQFAPHVGVIYFEEKQKSYADTLGIYIPSQKATLGRVTFGPKVSYRAALEDGTILDPFVSIKGIWDFDKAKIVDLTTGEASSTNDGIRGRFEGGLSLRMPNGITISGQGFYDGVGANDFESYGGSIRLKLPFN